jgi:hypothetical protein
MKRHAVLHTRSALLILVGLLGSLLLSGQPGQAQHEPGHPQIINLYADGPQPPQTDVAAGAAVVWVSHLAHTNLVVVTVTFAEGHRVTQATTPVQGYNGFVLEGHALRGRMEGNGGKVAMRFLTPSTSTSTLDHNHLTGTIVVRETEGHVWNRPSNYVPWVRHPDLAGAACAGGGTVCASACVKRCVEQVPSRS